jgi:hypothetical protein
VTVTTSKKIANFWRAVALPERLDEAIVLLEEINARNADEPGTEIQAFHLEAPNVIWLYALFDDRDALEEHRRLNNADPKFHALRELFSEYEQSHETTPLFAKGIATGA